jgi:hypothetical protein
MTPLRVAVLAGDPELVRRAARLLPMIRESQQREAAVVTITGARHSAPGSFGETATMLASRRQDQAAAVLAGSVDLVVSRARDLPDEIGLWRDNMVVLARSDTPRVRLDVRAGQARPDCADPIGVPGGSRIGVATEAMACQVLARRPDLTVVPWPAFELGPAVDGLDDDVAAVCVTSSAPGPSWTADSLHLAHEALLPAGGDETMVVFGPADDPLAKLRNVVADPVATRCFEAERALTNRWDEERLRTTTCLASVAPDGTVRLQAVAGCAGGDVSVAPTCRVAVRAPDWPAAVVACRHALREARPA